MASSSFPIREKVIKSVLQLPGFSNIREGKKWKAGKNVHAFKDLTLHVTYNKLQDLLQNSRLRIMSLSDKAWCL